MPEDGDIAVGVLERSIRVRNHKRNLEFLQKLQLWHEHLPQAVHSEVVLCILNIKSVLYETGCPTNWEPLLGALYVGRLGTFWKPPIHLSMGVYSGLQV